MSERELQFNLAFKGLWKTLQWFRFRIK